MIVWAFFNSVACALEAWEFSATHWGFLLVLAGVNGTCAVIATGAAVRDV